MKGIIDRFEEDFAVVELEDETMKNIPKDLLPLEVKEGSVLIIDGDNIYIDEEKTEERKRKADKLLEDLFN
ncbi:DUF3006 domain-containing protein [Proteiniborus sp. MB09-C3]|uniref:DUF3006 domain-containing protein n=1 Tax=Proteiniborus sp. MB09-C3 TaxID=3050072 RepID=UPI0025528DC0|nr:DUF3006 domain-containing protein [Proteiniborus sp. MB09-C3]WIV11277.1 DUF3006 domain-containing protein [Proteiniborus sp. MB09-C3]